MVFKHSDQCLLLILIISAFLQLLHYLKNLKRHVNDHVLTIQCTSCNHSCARLWLYRRFTTCSFWKKEFEIEVGKKCLQGEENLQQAQLFSCKYTNEKVIKGRVHLSNCDGIIIPSITRDNLFRYYLLVRG